MGRWPVPGCEKTVNKNDNKGRTRQGTQWYMMLHDAYLKEALSDGKGFDSLGPAPSLP